MGRTRQKLGLKRSGRSSRLEVLLKVKVSPPLD